MQTKSLFAAAAIFAAGFASTLAATYTVPLTCHFTLLANSLDAGSGPSLNRADAVIPFVDGNGIQIWTGVSWEVWTMDSLSPSGWTGPAGNNAPLTSLPILGPGRGFFYENNSGAASITFTGTVRSSPIAVPVPLGLSCLGSPHVYSGSVSSGPIALQVQDGDNIQKWHCGTWYVVSRDSLSSTGWTDNSGDIPEPTLAIGEGFFYGNNIGSFLWLQP